jgi:predicted DNA-binding transcriptional regulator AlpA
MKKALRELLQKIIDDLDCGNSNYPDEEELIEIVETLRRYTRKDELLSKYQAYTFLNMSRATFDNKVRSGEIPKGIKVQGFKELMWNKKDLTKLCK